MSEKSDNCIDTLLNDEYSWNKISHFMQSPSWISCFHKNQHFKHFCTYLKGNIVAYSLARIRKTPLFGNIMRVEWGPVAIEEQHMARHLKYLKNLQGITQLEISTSYKHMDENIFEKMLRSQNFKKRDFRRANYSHTLVLDLTVELSEIKSKFRRSLKTQINKALKKGIIVKSDDHLDELSIFYNDFAQKKRLEPFSEEQIKFLKKRSGIYRDIILSAYHNEKLLGVIFLIDNGDTIIYQWGASVVDENDKKLPIAHLLHWEGIKHAKKLGFNFYDFGGYWKEKGDNDSINRFKTGFCKNIKHVSDEYIYSSKPIRNYFLEKIIKSRI